MNHDLLSADRVRTMLTVAREGSFTRAAAALGVSQPAISQQVRKVEEELGRPLFVRGTQSLSLTSDGEAFLAYAQAMHDIGEHARRQFAQPRIEGSLRLGMSDEFVRTALPGVLSLVFAQFPGFELEARCEPGHRLLGGIEEGRYDLVIGRQPVGRGRGRALGRSELGWVGRDHAQRFRGGPVPLVLPPAPDMLRDVALRALRDAGLSWRIRFQTTSLAAAEAAIRAGIGVSAYPLAVPLLGVVVLRDSQLPPLPEEEIYLERAARPDAGVDAIAALIGAAVERYLAQSRARQV